MSDKRPFTFAFAILPKFNTMTISALVEPLRIANYCADEEIYAWHYLSVDGENVPSCTGMTLPTDKVSIDNTDWDAIIVCGGWNAARYDNQEFVRWLRLMARRGISMGAAETGAYVLARAGLLSGYKATIHWHCHQAFEESHPDIDLKEQLFVIDRNRFTCAGGTAGVDMMLHHIEQQHSNALSLEVSALLVHGATRNAAKPQRETQEGKQTAVPLLLQTTINIMEDNIEEPIKIPELAKTVDISQRKLERLFNKYFNCSAVAFYRVIRLQQARALLTQTDMSVLDICIACGFTSSSYFSKSYTSQFGMRPRDHRTDWPDTEASPIWPGTSTSTNQTHKYSLKEAI